VAGRYPLSVAFELAGQRRGVRIGGENGDDGRAVDEDHG
jgi:hypothetical protein